MERIRLHNEIQSGFRVGGYGLSVGLTMFGALQCLCKQNNRPRCGGLNIFWICVLLRILLLCWRELCSSVCLVTS